MADQPNEVVAQQATQADQQVAQQSVQSNGFDELLSSIKSEDGRQKYDSVEKALKSLPHANEHISKLEQEMKELREELAKRKTAEEIIERLEQSKVNAPVETPQPTIDLSQIESLINNTLTKKQREDAEKQNINSVVSVLGKTYGEKAEEIFYMKAAEIGLSRDEINRLARTSPKAALKIAGIAEQQSSAPASISSSVNTEAFGATKPNNAPSNKLPPYPTAEQLRNAWRASKV